MKRRAFIWFVSLLGLAAACYIYSSDRMLFRKPVRWVNQSSDQIAERLKADGLAMLVTFGKGNPREWVRGATVAQSGVAYVQGPTGGARRFDGHQRTFIETSVPWMALEDSFSLSVWVKLDALSENQDILFSSLGGVQVGLKLDQGNMAFFIPATRAHRQVVAYPFERYGEFVHLVAVADAQAGKAYLYENGNLMAKAGIDDTFPVYHNVEFGKRRWFGVRHPLKGDLGESAIWRRALTMEEVVGLSERRTSLLNQIASS